MATFTGKSGAVKVGTNAIAEVKDWSINQTAETADSTSLSSAGGWRTHNQTLKAQEGSLNCFWDDTDANGQGALTIGASVTLNLYPEGETSGDEEYSGTATITGITINSAVDGNVEASFTFQGNGALTIGQAS